MGSAVDLTKHDTQQPHRQTVCIFRCGQWPSKQYNTHYVKASIKFTDLSQPRIATPIIDQSYCQSNSMPRWPSCYILRHPSQFSPSGHPQWRNEYGQCSQPLLGWKNGGSSVTAGNVISIAGKQTRSVKYDGCNCNHAKFIGFNLTSYTYHHKWTTDFNRDKCFPSLSLELFCITKDSWITTWYITFKTQPVLALLLLQFKVYAHTHTHTNTHQQLFYWLLSMLKVGVVHTYATLHMNW